jgi:hypothetical protein
VIIRILGDDQYEVADDQVDSLNELDGQLEKAVEGGDEGAFGAALAALLGRVRDVGTTVALDSLTPSDLILPPDSASLAEVRDMLNDDGLIPG